MLGAKLGIEDRLVLGLVLGAKLEFVLGLLLFVLVGLLVGLEVGLEVGTFVILSGLGFALRAMLGMFDA